VISAVQSSSDIQGLQALFTTIGIVIAAITVLIIGLFVYRGRRKPGSRAAKIAEAGVIAIPGVLGVIAGAVGLMLGVAYFVVLFFYWLLWIIVGSIWVSIVGGKLTPPAEFGQLAGIGLLYAGLGILVSALSFLYLGLVVFRAVSQSVKPPPQPAGGVVYDAAVLAPPPVTGVPASETAPEGDGGGSTPAAAPLAPTPRAPSTPRARAPRKRPRA
jgi:hypothetical protein